MKVIGNGVGSYLVEMSSTELAHLLGYQSEYSEGFKGKNFLGSGIDIHSSYSALRSLADIERVRKNAEREVEKLKESLADIKLPKLVTAEALEKK